MRTTLREKDGEKILLEVKRHWWVLLGPAFFPTIAIYKRCVQQTCFIRSGGFSYLLYSQQRQTYCTDSKHARWISGLLPITELFPSLVNREAKESPLDKINNVQVSQTTLGRSLDFGDLEIQTAATQGATIDKYVSSPNLIHDTIVEAQEALLKARGTESQSSQPQRSVRDEVECPFCAELILRKAKVCRYCNRELRHTGQLLPAPVAPSGARQPVTLSQQEKPSDGKEASGPRDWTFKA